jgi:P-type conjugative transfer protein TrbJ
MKKTLTICLLLVLSYAKTSYSIFGVGDVVHDPLAYLVHIKNEFNTQKAMLESAQHTIQQAQMLQYQLLYVQYAAQNLSKNPLTLLQQIQGLWAQYNAILQNAEGLTYNLAQASAQFEYTYPAAKAVGVGGLLANISAASTQQLAAIRAASKSAVQSQSVVDRLCDQQAQNAKALTAAQAAVGNLQIQQAQAQLTGLTNEQLASIQQITAANGRIEATYFMRQASAEEQAAANGQYWLQMKPVAPWTSFKGEGEALP